MKPEYDFSKGERGKCYKPDAVLHIPVTQDEISKTEWLQAAAGNPAFDFLKDDDEDIYSVDDGKPFCDEK
ncbi:protein of unknown function [Candidatus Promineifilum breve]|uniref:Uncharacterized protein n=1 Tax=Candidatus Promineifilum breve TaxID=1806508 RepID=A0A170PGE7_9CHLR|nr:hypothetical protein [Candidatus Promineifilum breve]CUS03717.2 protein of unknown function [Candidatus Promineifilum breve]